jgi:hypothetical protein
VLRHSPITESGAQTASSARCRAHTFGQHQLGVKSSARWKFERGMTVSRVPPALGGRPQAFHADLALLEVEFADHDAFAMFGALGRAPRP